MNDLAIFRRIYLRIDTLSTQARSQPFTCPHFLKYTATWSSLEFGDSRFHRYDIFLHSLIQTGKILKTNNEQPKCDIAITEVQFSSLKSLTSLPTTTTSTHVTSPFRTSQPFSSVPKAPYHRYVKGYNARRANLKTIINLPKQTPKLAKPNASHTMSAPTYLHASCYPGPNRKHWVQARELSGD